MGLIQIFTDVVADTGVKFYPDRSINTGTRALFDMGAGSVYGTGKDLPAGSEVKSLASDTVGMFSKAHVYSGGGMVFTGVNGDTFNLPDTAAPQPDETHWLITAWMKFSHGGAGTPSSGNNQTLSFSTSPLNISSESMLTVVHNPVGGGVSGVSVFARGKNYSGLGAALSPIYDGALHQVAFELQLDGNKQQLTVYIDGVVAYTSGYGAVVPTIPASPTNRYIGTSAPFPLAGSGTFYRYRKDDLTATDKTVSEILAADKDVAGTRFV